MLAALPGTESKSTKTSALRGCLLSKSLCSTAIVKKQKGQSWGLSFGTTVKHQKSFKHQERRAHGPQDVHVLLFWFSRCFCTNLGMGSSRGRHLIPLMFLGKLCPKRKHTNCRPNGWAVKAWGHRSCSFLFFLLKSRVRFHFSRKTNKNLEFGKPSKPKLKALWLGNPSLGT